MVATLGALTAWHMGTGGAASLPAEQLAGSASGGKSSGSPVRWWTARPRRSAGYLMAVLVLLGGNLLAVGDHVWSRTRGFGLVGEQSPEAAMHALEATSRLSELGEWHSKAGHLSEADCPEGERYSLR